MASIEMKNIVKEYGDGFPAVNDVSIDVADGEFMILVGPSGCGKSTLLRMIVGLEDITSGDMVIGDKKVNDLAPRDRNLAMVFQNYALYPHLTVYENIAFPLRLAKADDATVDKKVREASKTLDLDEHLDRKPGNLFVAGFIGSPPMNFVPATIEGTSVKLPFGSVEIPADKATRATGKGLLIAGIRPEHFEDAGLMDAGETAGQTFKAKVDAV